MGRWAASHQARPRSWAKEADKQKGPQSGAIGSLQGQLRDHSKQGLEAQNAVQTRRVGSPFSPRSASSE